MKDGGTVAWSAFSKVEMMVDCLADMKAVQWALKLVVTKAVSLVGSRACELAGL